MASLRFPDIVGCQDLVCRDKGYSEDIPWKMRSPKKRTNVAWKNIPGQLLLDKDAPTNQTKKSKPYTLR